MSIAKIREAAAKMAALLSKMDATVDECENSLIDMGLGLEETVASGNVSLSFRRINGKFKIVVVVEDTGVPWGEVEPRSLKTVMEWQKADSALKVAAFSLLPRLLIALEAKADGMLQKHEKAVEDTCRYFGR